MKKKIIIISIVVILAAIGVYFYLKNKSDKEAEALAEIKAEEEYREDLAIKNNDLATELPIVRTLA